MTKTVDEAGAEVARVVKPEHVDIEIARLFDLVPFDTELAEGELDAQLLSVTSIEELARAGKMLSSKDMDGRTVRVEDVTKRESDNPDSGPFYLVCRGTEGPHRKPITWATSARGVINKLLMINQLGALPAVVTLRTGVSKSTKREYGDLDIIAAGGKVFKTLDS